MKLLLDMNLSPRWVDLFKGTGWETLHWSEVGRGNELDSEIMAYAQQHDFVVVTHDLDFSAILAANKGKKPSVVQLRMEDVSTKAAGAQVVAALRGLQAELEAGVILTVGPHQTRARMLPLIPNR